MGNAYFQLLNKPNGTFMRIVPPVDGGIQLQIKEVMKYLDSRAIIYDLKKLNEAVENTSQESIVTLNLDQMRPERESYLLSVDENHMRAIVRFYAPSEGGELMSAEELRRDLMVRHISHGIKEDVIASFFANHKPYCTSLVIAEGKEPRQGTDAKIEYFFNTNLKAKPAVREDGSVDFHDLNAINHCHKDDLLAKIIPADAGEAGKNLFGENIRPREVKSLRLQYGRNIALSEDRMSITSMVNGHVSLVGGKVFVSDVLEVENVDNATGDINYDGSVQVNGNVFTGFSVKASGNIEVNGVVEGAVMEAGGNITIARGMNGMSKGSITAKGHIVSKFLENTAVTAGEYVSAESILHCNVNAGTEIEVTGRKGFITGGHVMASNKITAKTLGSNLGASTIVEVGSDPNLKKEKFAIEKKYQDNMKNIRMMEPVITAFLAKKQQGMPVTADQMVKLQALVQARKDAMDENQQIEARLAELDVIMQDSDNPMVIVTGEVYPGTKIVIKDVSKMIRDAVSYCRFIRAGGDVKMTSV